MPGRHPAHWLYALLAGIFAYYQRVFDTGEALPYDINYQAQSAVALPPDLIKSQSLIKAMDAYQVEEKNLGTITLNYRT